MDLTVLHGTFNVTHHEVEFKSLQGGPVLSGTLSLPDSAQKPPVVILIHGVGAFDRDYTQVSGQKLFLTLADYFTRHGIAVLRYDKRGVGKSTGNFKAASTFDFVQDVTAAIHFLKISNFDIDSQKIGLLGHSEGGLVSFIVASQLPDVAFVISMAGAVITGCDDLLAQAELLFKAAGATDAFIASDRIIRRQILETITTLSVEDAEKKLLPLVKAYVEGMTDQQKIAADSFAPFGLTEKNYQYWIVTFNSVWRAILLSNPGKFIRKVTVPVLALNGQLDVVVPAHLALPIISKELKNGGNQDVTIVPLPAQNHSFQECFTGALSEYSKLKEPIPHSTLMLMAEWILSRV